MYGDGSKLEHLRATGVEVSSAVEVEKNGQTTYVHGDFKLPAKFTTMPVDGTTTANKPFQVSRLFGSEKVVAVIPKKIKKRKDKRPEFSFSRVFGSKDTVAAESTPA